MARRAGVGLIWCVALYFGACYAVGIVAQNRAAARQVEAGEDPATVAAEAAKNAIDSSRHWIAFGVVGFVFLASRFGFLPGMRLERPPAARR